MLYLEENIYARPMARGVLIFGQDAAPLAGILESHLLRFPCPWVCLDPAMLAMQALLVHLPGSHGHKLIKTRIGRQPYGQPCHYNHGVACSGDLPAKQSASELSSTNPIKCDASVRRCLCHSLEGSGFIMTLFRDLGLVRYASLSYVAILLRVAITTNDGEDPAYPADSWGQEMMGSLNLQAANKASSLPLMFGTKNKLPTQLRKDGIETKSDPRSQLWAIASRRSLPRCDRVEAF